MKQIFKSIVMLLAISTAIPAMASANSPSESILMETQQTKKYVVVNGTNVRLRFEPSLDASWLCYDNGSPRYAKKGTKLAYLGEADGFYYVEFQGNKVYISKDYSYVTTESPATAKTSTKKSDKFYVVVNGTNVRLRTGPGTNYVYYTWKDGSPCYLPKGTYLTHLGESGEFYKVEYNGKTVYISKKFSYITK
ncbi:MAG: hypothetical protein II612_05060 [Prevotella sp.]|nr:hypothetical protein [Prevotella sp.]